MAKKIFHFIYLDRLCSFLFQEREQKFKNILQFVPAFCFIFYLHSFQFSPFSFPVWIQLRSWKENIKWMTFFLLLLLLLMFFALLIALYCTERVNKICYHWKCWIQILMINCWVNIINVLYLLILSTWEFIFCLFFLFLCFSLFFPSFGWVIMKDL